MAQKLCSKCGEYNKTSSMVCVICGNSLVDAKIVGEVVNFIGNGENKICPKCGETLKNGSRNCHNCGFFITKTSGSEKAENVYYENNSSDENGFLYVISAIIPLVGYIAGAIYLTKDEGYKKDVGEACIILGILSTIVKLIIFKIIN